jgi:hypothetical protein
VKSPPRTGPITVVALLVSVVKRAVYSPPVAALNWMLFHVMVLVG